MSFSLKIKSFFSSFLRNIGGIAFSAATYLLLSVASVILFESVPTLQMKALSILILVLLFGFFTKVRVKLQDVAEKEVDDLRTEKDRLANELDAEKNKFNLANDLRLKQSSKMLDFNSIFQISYISVDLEHHQAFDYYVGKLKPLKEDQIKITHTEKTPFNFIKRGQYADGAKRIIGYYRIPYQAKIGIDLRKVKIHVENETAYYSLPDIEINGIKPEKAKWDVMMELDFSDSIIDSRDCWTLKCKPKEGESHFFRDQLEESIDIINKQIPAEISSIIKDAILKQAEKTVSAIIQYQTGLKPNRVNSSDEIISSSGVKIMEYFERK